MFRCQNIFRQSGAKIKRMKYMCNIKNNGVQSLSQWSKTHTNIAGPESASSVPANSSACNFCRFLSIILTCFI